MNEDIHIHEKKMIDLNQTAVSHNNDANGQTVNNNNMNDNTHSKDRKRSWKK